MGNNQINKSNNNNNTPKSSDTEGQVQNLQESQDDYLKSAIAELLRESRKAAETRSDRQLKIILCWFLLAILLLFVLIIGFTNGWSTFYKFFGKSETDLEIEKILIKLEEHDQYSRE